MGLAGFKFDDRLARLNRRETKTDQLRDRRGRRLAEQPSLYPINHLGRSQPLSPPVKSSIQVVRGADQRQMRECLREISQRLAAGAGLLSIQSHMVRVTEHPFEDQPRFI